MPKNSVKTPDSAHGAPPLNPAAVAVEDLARMLGLGQAVLRQHVADGAPTNADGSINLVHYAAWLNAPRAHVGQGGADGD